MLFGSFSNINGINNWAKMRWVDAFAIQCPNISFYLIVHFTQIHDIAISNHFHFCGIVHMAGYMASSTAVENAMAGYNQLRVIVGLFLIILKLWQSFR